MTPAETALWEHLRGREFRRQHTVGRFVRDFASPKCLLAIEVDGSVHLGRELEDEERQRILESQGWRFLRFPNAEIQDTLSAVLAQIEATLQPPHRSYPE